MVNQSTKANLQISEAEMWGRYSYCEDGDMGLYLYSRMGTWARLPSSRIHNLSP